jgi:GTP-binding protein HflX
LQNFSAIVVQPELTRFPTKRPVLSTMEEACSLAKAIGLEVLHSEIVTINKLRARDYFGKGTVKRLSDLILNLKVNHTELIVFVNTRLSPIQQRNLETAMAVKVIDRTQLILEIFGARAETRSGRLQVELAALNFQRSRLVRSWTHLERQRGGGGFLGGPGERQIELDRRLLKNRINRIKDELTSVVRTRNLQRKSPWRTDAVFVALVGYTNAGKSTLFNRLTGAKAFSKDMLFATLDPTIREFDYFAGQKMAIADTVGFISDLPIELIEAFKSTLEVVTYADILIHVHDASSPSFFEESEDVKKVLASLEVNAESQKTPTLHVLNKIDLIKTDVDQLIKLKNIFPKGVMVSAAEGDGIDDLISNLGVYLDSVSILLEVFLRPTEGAARAWLYEHANVKYSEFFEDGSEKMYVKIKPINNEKFLSRWPSVEQTQRMKLV